MQLLGLLLLYLMGGAGCAAVAALQAPRRHLLELMALALLWPLYAPFVLASSAAHSSHAASNMASQGRRETELLQERCAGMRQRLAEIDQLLASEDWDRGRVRKQLRALDEREHEGQSELADSLRLRLEHIDRLHFLRKLHAEELEAAAALLQQLKAQMQLSRFLHPEDRDARARLQEVRERILSAEDALAAETELLSLCHES